MKFNLKLEDVMKMLKVFIILLVFMVAFGCGQTIQLGYVWDKNTEVDMMHYDLFTLTLDDSAAFWQLTEWPADTSIKNFPIDSLIHYPNHLATIAHIHDSPIDTVLFEFTHSQQQKFLRAYLIAIDSVGNYSTMSTSWNIVYIGDRESPAIPNQKRIIRFP